MRFVENDDVICIGILPLGAQGFQLLGSIDRATKAPIMVTTMRKAAISKRGGPKDSRIGETRYPVQRIRKSFVREASRIDVMDCQTMSALFVSRTK